MRIVLLIAAAASLHAADYRAPAGTRAVAVRRGAESILPGGRIVSPVGRQAIVGPGARGLAINAKGDRVAVANAGTISVLRVDRNSWHMEHVDPLDREREDDAKGTPVLNFEALAFADDDQIFASEGGSGRVRQIDTGNGRTRHIFDVNEPKFPGSVSGELAFDRVRQILYVVDPASGRLVGIDTRRRRQIVSPEIPRPHAIALAPDGRRAYVSSGADSLAVVDLENPAAAIVTSMVRTGAPGEFSSLAVSADHVFAADPVRDAVTVVDARDAKVVAEISIRIPGLESLRGVAPVAAVFHAPTGWLLVAEAGINALGVIDVAARKVIGHIPTAWSPRRVAVHNDLIWVASAHGHGVGPNATKDGRRLGARLGTLQHFAFPDVSELDKLTARVMENNGFVPRKDDPLPLPVDVRHVVIVVKGNRSYDEILGDIEFASNGPVNGAPTLARLGRYGVILQSRQALQTRLGVRNVNVTPNHHALAQGWSMSDNYYAAPLPAPAALGRHLAAHGISFREFSDAYPRFDPRVPDQYRATRFIEEIDKYEKAGAQFPRVVFLHLPNGRTAPPRSEDGFPFEASYIADNDYALGRVVERLSRSPWWKQMAILVADDDAQGLDHIDARRTVFIAVGPYVRKNYVSHFNTSFPGLLKTALRLVGAPPMNLFDATASDLADCFTSTPDFAPYELQPARPEVFDPSKVRAPQRESSQ